MRYRRRSRRTKHDRFWTAKYYFCRKHALNPERGRSILGGVFILYDIGGGCYWSVPLGKPCDCDECKAKRFGLLKEER